MMKSAHHIATGQGQSKLNLLCNTYSCSLPYSSSPLFFGANKFGQFDVMVNSVNFMASELIFINFPTTFGLITDIETISIVFWMIIIVLTSWWGCIDLLDCNFWRLSDFPDISRRYATTRCMLCHLAIWVLWACDSIARSFEDRTMPLGSIFLCWQLISKA